LKSPITRKITLIIVLISFGSILISGLFINYSLNRQFQKYLTRVDTARENQVINILAQIYLDNGGWPQQPTLLGMGRDFYLERLFYITDTDGNVVFYTRMGRIRSNQRPDLLKPRPIIIGEKTIGTAYFGKSPIENVLTQQNVLFRHTINHSIVLSILVTGSISFIVAILFARRFSNPIRAMNLTAKAMTNGNLDTRVRDLPRDELGQLGESLNTLADSLKYVQALRQQMTANVAHDLRTPLATIQSHLEGMIDDVIPVSTANLESLLDEVKRLSGLVEDLQEIALADQAIHHFKYEPIALEEFLQILINKKTPLFAEKGLHLLFKSTGPVQLVSDRKSLSKIMDNLLSNAHKYTAPGGHVTITLSHTTEKVHIEVTDTGIGISEVDLPYIFERFYRTDQSRNRESGGFGLGLTIVKELVEALGGTITVRSQPGQGSTFTINFATTPNQRNNPS